MKFQHQGVEPANVIWYTSKNQNTRFPLSIITIQENHDDHLDMVAIVANVINLFHKSTYNEPNAFITSQIL